MIHVIATIELAQGRRQAFLEEFHKIVSEVRQEDGCIEYGPAVDVATDLGAQQPVRENVVTVIEKWESIAALKAHMSAPHMQQYRSKVKEWVLSTKLFILEPA